jgi:hypothetical protein
MHSLEGTDSEYNKKAILAALHHLSRHLEPEALRPGKEVKQSIGKKGCEVGWVTALPSRLCMGQKVAPCPKAVGSPRFLMIKPDRVRQAQNPLLVGLNVGSSVEKEQRLGPVHYFVWQQICQIYRYQPSQV